MAEPKKGSKSPAAPDMNKPDRANDNDKKRDHEKPGERGGKPNKQPK